MMPYNKVVLSQRNKRAAGTPSLPLRRPKPRRYEFLRRQQ